MAKTSKKSKEKTAGLPENSTPPKATPGETFSITEVFAETLLGFLKDDGKLLAHRGEPIIRKDEMVSGDVYVLIPISSLVYDGHLALAFDTPTFLYVANALERRRDTKISYDNVDVAMTIVAKLMTQAREGLVKYGHIIGQGSPMVFLGQNHQIYNVAVGRCEAVRFKSKVGILRLEVILNSRQPLSSNESPHLIPINETGNGSSSSEQKSEEEKKEAA